MREDGASSPVLEIFSLERGKNKPDAEEMLKSKRPLTQPIGGHLLGYRLCATRLRRKKGKSGIISLPANRRRTKKANAADQASKENLRRPRRALRST